MTDAELKELVKTDLQLSYATNTTLGGQMDTLLEVLIASAKEQLRIKGITLDVTNLGDCDLVRMFVNYLYKCRFEESTTIPRNLRLAINERLLSEKAGENE